MQYFEFEDPIILVSFISQFPFFTYWNLNYHQHHMHFHLPRNYCHITQNLRWLSCLSLILQSSHSPFSHLEDLKSTFNLQIWLKKTKNDELILKKVDHFKLLPRSEKQLNDVLMMVNLYPQLLALFFEKSLWFTLCRGEFLFFHFWNMNVNLIVQDLPIVDSFQSLLDIGCLQFTVKKERRRFLFLLAYQFCPQRK